MLVENFAVSKDFCVVHPAEMRLGMIYVGWMQDVGK